MIIKICGITDPAHLRGAVQAGASHIGLVFHPRSPRYLTVGDAKKISVANNALVKPVQIVALVADPDRDVLSKIVETVQPDAIQFHGDESPEILQQWRQELPQGIELWKAVGVSVASDLATINSFVPCCDRVLLDAKPPKNAAHKGGHGRSFDWAILSSVLIARPWLLAGGLTPANVGLAIEAVSGLANFRGVDVSSGVEIEPGQKDPALIAAFIKRASQAMDRSVS